MKTSQLLNCTIFRHPTDEWLWQLDICRSHKLDCALSSSGVANGKWEPLRDQRFSLQDRDLSNEVFGLRDRDLHSKTALQKIRDCDTFRTAQKIKFCKTFTFLKAIGHPSLWIHVQIPVELLLKEIRDFVLSCSSSPSPFFPIPLFNFALLENYVITRKFKRRDPNV